METGSSEGYALLMVHGIGFGLDSRTVLRADFPLDEPVPAAPEFPVPSFPFPVENRGRRRVTGNGKPETGNAWYYAGSHGEHLNE